MGTGADKFLRPEAIVKVLHHNWGAFNYTQKGLHACQGLLTEFSLAQGAHKEEALVHEQAFNVFLTYLSHSPHFTMLHTNHYSSYVQSVLLEEEMYHPRQLYSSLDLDC